ncbi:MAG: hypothetical protein NT126_05875 [Bacteroidetes bacterium]|nr:hypothetical protein [Bacteroidota bacterium]
MKKLSQNHPVVSTISLAGIPVVGEIGQTKLNKLLVGFSQGSFKTDQEAASVLYRTSSKNKRYLMLKTRLKERVLDRFFLADENLVWKSQYGKSYYQCVRNVFAAQIMITKDRRKSAVDLLRITLQKTRYYSFTDLSFMITRILRHDAALKGDQAKWKYYDRLTNHYYKLQQAEISAEKYSETIVTEFARKTPSDKKISKKAKACYQKICELSAKHRSYAIEMDKFRTGIRYYTIVKEHRKAIYLCSQCEKYLFDNPQFLQNVRIAEMALFKMDNYLALRDAERSEHYAAQCEKYFNREHLNWIIFKEYDFLLSMQTGNTVRALQIFYDVTGHLKFKDMNPERREKWKIFEAYLNYVLPDQLPKKQFNLFKFLNEISIYSKDKKGYNFALIVAQIILLIETGRFGKLVKLEEAFDKYVKRYISRKNNLRSYYFSKMLLVLFRYDFDPEKSRQIGTKFLEKLSKITPVYNGELESTEVIPYDMLWELLLKKLHNQKAETKKNATASGDR